MTCPTQLADAWRQRSGNDQARLIENHGPPPPLGMPTFSRKAESESPNSNSRLCFCVASFLAYVALGARRSVREAARQNHVKTTSAGDIKGVEDTTVRTWITWSAKHKWVSRSLARDEWIARTSDEQIVSNVTACKLALVTRAHDFLTSTDSVVFLRGARAFTLQHPPVQQVEDVTPIEDLPDLSDADLDRMRAIRDEARQKNGVTPPS